jgi:hypothetical protein
MEKYLLLSVFLLLFTGCENFAKQPDKGAVNPKFTTALLQQQTLPVSITIGIADDISGSFTLSPQKRELADLLNFFQVHPGRELIGYTTIEDNSYTPIIRYSDVPPIIENKTPDKTNPWIESERAEETTLLLVNKAIDSLNTVNLQRFNDKIRTKTDRQTAGYSDVNSALRRISLFLNEATTGTMKYLILASDCKDNVHKEKITIDSTIQVLIVGDATPSNICRVTGLKDSQYKRFESFEEAIAYIIQNQITKT